MWIDLEGVWINTEHAAVVRESSLDSDQTVLFTAGQDSTSGGHLIDMPVEEVIERLQTIARHALAAEILDDLDSREVELP
jgi:hypothetical protein